jgi:hypothetical protein
MTQLTKSATCAELVPSVSTLVLLHRVRALRREVEGPRKSARSGLSPRMVRLSPARGRDRYGGDSTGDLLVANRLEQWDRGFVQAAEGGDLNGDASTRKTA